MAKHKIIESLQDTSKQYYELIKQGYKVYPVYHKYKWWIEYEYKGELTRFTKPISSNEINLSINKTIIHLYKNINNDN
jgi:hypothetical protein